MKKVNGIFCFKVKSKNKEGTWIVNLKTGSGSVKFDPHGTGMSCVVTTLCHVVYQSDLQMALLRV